MLLYEEKIKTNRPEFVKKVQEISEKLGIEPNWLMFVMNFETAGTMNHAITNSIGATGLIQFLKSTAISLGTTTNALRAMTNVQQLDYVYKYLKPYQGRMNDWLDVYLAVFYPAVIGKPDTYRITSDQVAIQNPVFDINKDRDITIGEIRTVLNKRIPAGAFTTNFYKKKIQ